MKILYVSSFNEKLYKISATRFIFSFLDKKIEGDLLLTYEANNKNKAYINFLKELNSPIIKLYNLSENEYLINWLNENKDYIPTQYGGIYDTKKSSKKIIDMMNKSNYNKKASLWFRKIASLKYTLDTYYEEYDYIIWTDIDCYFNKFYSQDFLIKNFNNTSCFYHIGPGRKHKCDSSVESGFIGFKKGEGYKLLQNVIDLYKDQNFLKYKRWDDGYIFSVIIRSDKISSIDLVNKKSNSIDGILYGPFRKYIIHNKGSHYKNCKKHQLVNNYKDYENNIMNIIK